MADIPISQSVLEASGVVGSWTHDHWTGRLTLLGSLPELLGLDPEAAANGVTLEAFLDRTHPDDRTRIENYLHTVAETGGPMAAEFRTRDSRDGVRTLLMRGRMGRGQAGPVARGHGIAIDRTEEQAASVAQAERLVHRMAEHTLALRMLAQAFERPALTRQIERLMIAIGFELARFLPDPGSESRH